MRVSFLRLRCRVLTTEGRMGLKYVLIFAGGLVAFIGSGMIWARTATRPGNLGVREGRLAPCPDTPNCVATQSGDADQKMDPVSYTAPRAAAQARLLAAVRGMARAKVVVSAPGYVVVEFRSRVFGFVDDVAFLFDDTRKVIHFRAAARLGYSDLGVNRKRMVAIQEVFQHHQKSGTSGAIVP